MNREKIRIHEGPIGDDDPRYLPSDEQGWDEDPPPDPSEDHDALNVTTRGKPLLGDGLGSRVRLGASPQNCIGANTR